VSSFVLWVDQDHSKGSELVFCAALFCPNDSPLRPDIPTNSSNLDGF